MAGGGRLKRRYGWRGWQCRGSRCGHRAWNRIGAAAGALVCSWHRAWVKHESSEGRVRQHTSFALGRCVWQAQGAGSKPESLRARPGTHAGDLGVGMCGMLCLPGASMLQHPVSLLHLVSMVGHLLMKPLWRQVSVVCSTRCGHPLYYNVHFPGRELGGAGFCVEQPMPLLKAIGLRRCMPCLRLRQLHCASAECYASVQH